MNLLNCPPTDSNIFSDLTGGQLKTSLDSNSKGKTNRIMATLTPTFTTLSLFPSLAFPSLVVRYMLRRK